MSRRMDVHIFELSKYLGEHDNLKFWFSKDEVNLIHVYTKLTMSHTSYIKDNLHKFGR